MFIVITIVSAIMASIGLGGGAIYVLLMNLFNVCEHDEAIIYNLIMFIFVGITATITNIKNKQFDKKIFFSMVIFTFLFAILGANLAKGIDTSNLRKYFNMFILAIGIYEIFSSLINMKKDKNNS